MLQEVPEHLKPQMEQIKTEILLMTILIIAETWLKPDTQIRVAGYNTYRMDRDDHYGGVLIWIHHSIPVSTIQTSTPENRLQYIIINTTIASVIGVYVPPNYPYSSGDLENVIQYSTKQQKVIAGDFNIPQPSIEPVIY